MYLSALLLVGCIALQYRLAARWRSILPRPAHMADACLAGAVLAGWRASARLSQLDSSGGYRLYAVLPLVRCAGPGYAGLPPLVAAIPTGLVSGSACNITARSAAPSCKTKNLCYNTSIRPKGRLIALLSDGAFHLILEPIGCKEYRRFPTTWTLITAEVRPRYPGEDQLNEAYGLPKHVQFCNECVMSNKAQLLL